MTHFGYAGNILRIDLSSGKIEVVPTETYSEQFLGGRGIAAKVCWDEVPTQIGPFDAENRLVFATGPLACVPVIGGSRWEVCSKSPATSPAHFSYCNLGGRWGAALKFAGYDAIVVFGKADSPVYILIGEDGIHINDARALWGMGAIETRESLKRDWGDSARVVTIGPAGENGVVMATLLADNDSSGAGGQGAVMGSKNLKAIVVAGAGKRPAIARPDKLKELTHHYRSLKRINLRFPPEIAATRSPMAPPDKIKKADPCYGCVGCYRMIYQANDGRTGKFMCNSGLYYQHWASQYGGDWMDVAFHANKTADTYGLDTKVVGMMINWLLDCYQVGIITEGDVDLPLSRVGTIEFIEAFVRKVSLREGFGDVLAMGFKRATVSLGSAAQEMARHTAHAALEGYRDIYSPQLYTPHALFYSLEPRYAMTQLHEMGTTIPKWVSWAQGNPKGLSWDGLRAIAKRFWGSEQAVDFSTYDGKALAAKMIQDREYVKECLILCDNIWPLIEVRSTENNVGDPTLESQLVSAVTGSDMDEDELYRIGERVFNLQRAIQVREGHHGREDDNLPESHFTEPLEIEFLNPDCLVPGKNGEAISRKGAVVDKQEFERMKDEFYAIRGWDVATGLQTMSKLTELGLQDVARQMAKQDLGI
ncbi:MAG: hypothetical protein HOC20_13465 [Chloroflexi bacterium]|jgi:aldehyde:ferredoxin oxidoreductase|nr:hypothetical protein [Chloroflexota bacterium]